MAEPELPRSKLTLWALSVLSQVTQAADHDPVPITPRLRLAMAWLAVATGEGPALDLWWEDARKPMDYNTSDYIKAYTRGTSLSLRFQGICDRIGTCDRLIRIHREEHPPGWPEPPAT